MSRGLVSTRLAFAAGLVVAACAGPLPDDEAESASEALIGGVPADSRALDAAAALAFVFEYEGGRYIEPFCSAIRIGERTYATAKHCVDRLYWGYGGYPIVSIGPDVMNPRQSLLVVDAARAPGNQGGVLGTSPDVGVVYVAEVAADPSVASPAALGTADLATRFGAVGYGVRDNIGRSGLRRAGSLTLRALEGKFFELVFGSFERFKEWYETGGYAGVLPYRSFLLPPAHADVGWDELGILVPGDVASATAGSAPQPKQDDEWLRQLYDNTWLAAGSEAWLGDAPGDAQPCFGDSGGPLLRRRGAQLEVYGVTSGGLASRDLPCDYGAIYAIFDPGTLSFLSEAMQWTDPCDGVPPEGTCDGSIARRCTMPFAEGHRRVVETDCSLLGQDCGRSDTGEIACVDPAP